MSQEIYLATSTDSYKKVIDPEVNIVDKDDTIAKISDKANVRF